MSGSPPRPQQQSAAELSPLSTSPQVVLPPPTTPPDAPRANRQLWSLEHPESVVPRDLNATFDALQRASLSHTNAIEHQTSLLEVNTLVTLSGAIVALAAIFISVRSAHWFGVTAGVLAACLTILVAALALRSTSTLLISPAVRRRLLTATIGIVVLLTILFAIATVHDS